MRVVFESPERLRIELDDEDLNDLDVTVEELDDFSAKTRRVLAELLERIGGDELLTPGVRRLVEVLPRREGGCVIYFTALRRAGSGAPRGERAVWAFADADALLAAAEALRAMAPRTGVRLYRMAQGYRLVLPGQTRAQECLLSEFAQPVADAGGRSTAEHGVLLTDRLLTVLPVSGRLRRAGP